MTHKFLCSGGNLSWVFPCIVWLLCAKSEPFQQTYSKDDWMVGQLWIDRSITAVIGDESEPTEICTGEGALMDRTSVWIESTFETRVWMIWVSVPTALCNSAWLSTSQPVAIAESCVTSRILLESTYTDILLYRIWLMGSDVKFLDSKSIMISLCQANLSWLVTFASS